MIRHHLIDCLGPLPVDHAILSLPARRSGSANPFPALLAEALETEGAMVCDFKAPGAFFKRFDAVILHWPDHFSSMGALPAALVKTASLLVLLTVQRLRGARVIRIVHDVTTIVGRNKWLTRLNRRLVARAATSYIFLSRSSRDAFYKAAPEERGKPSSLLFHPRFAETARPTPPSPRAPLSFIGDIKPYKGLRAFIELAAAERIPLELLVHGRCEDEGERVRLEETIERGRAAGLSITWRNERPGHAAFDRLIGEASALLLPYKEGWNSGVLIKALENATPALCSDLGVFREYAAALPGWVATYRADGTDLARKLEDVRRPLSEADRLALDAYLEGLGWAPFARSILELAAPETQRPAPASNQNNGKSKIIEADQIIRTECSNSF